MAILKDLVGSKVYLDTNIFIYALEGFDLYRSLLIDLFEKIDRKSILAFSSELSLAEALVKPYQLKNEALEKKYEAFIQDSESITLIPIHRDLLKKAAQLRSTLQLKLPDAIHLATALLCNCQFILSNDQDLLKLQQIPTFSLDHFLS